MGHGKSKKETFRIKMKASEWAFDRIKEAFELIAQDETEKMSIVPEIMLRSTDYLRRNIAPVGGEGGVTVSYLCPNCKKFPSGRLRVVGLCWKEAHKVVVRNLWRKVRLEGTTQAVGRAHWRSFEQAKVFKAHAVPQRLCAKLIMR